MNHCVYIACSNCGAFYCVRCENPEPDDDMKSFLLERGNTHKYLGIKCTNCGSEKTYSESDYRKMLDMENTTTKTFAFKNKGSNEHIYTTTAENKQLATEYFTNMKNMQLEVFKSLYDVVEKTKK